VESRVQNPRCGVSGVGMGDLFGQGLLQYCYSVSGASASFSSSSGLGTTTDRFSCDAVELN
jgi:hypothetical protein